MQWYREEARYLERTYDFVPRIGLDRIRAVIVDDAEGIAARLDAEMQRTVDSFVDPWLEAHQPVHPSQFNQVLEPAAAPVAIELSVSRAEALAFGGAETGR
jgi:nitrite reductase (NADH) large subunit